MKRKFARYIPILLLILMLASTACRRSLTPAQHNELHRLRTEGLKYLNTAKVDEAIAVGSTLLDSTKFSQSASNYHAAIYGRIILGQAYYMADSIEKAYTYLHEAETLCLEHKNDSALASVYNGLGLYATNVENDYTRGLSYLFKGIDAAKRAHNERLHSILLSNISTLYAFNNDPNGIHYAMECYHHGKKTQDRFLQYIGAVSTAMALILTQDYEGAQKFVSEAETLLHSNEINDYSTFSYTYGLLHERMGNTKEAMYYYTEALKVPPLFRDIRAHIALADIYQAGGNPAKAEALLRQALKISSNGHSRKFRHVILKNLARCLENRGKNAESEMMIKAVMREDSLLQAKTTQEIVDHLKLKYDIERTEKEIARQNNELRYNSTVIYFMTWISVLVMIGALSCYVLYRRKSKLYTSIVRQASEAAKMEESLRLTIKRLESDRNVSSDTAPQISTTVTQIASISGTSTPKESLGSSATEESADSSVAKDSGFTSKSSSAADTPDYPDFLHAQFEALMEDRNVYTDNTISKEKVAKMLCTNRTYISKLVNHVYRMTFTEFINSLRIKEAIRRLSDSTDDTPLKILSEQLGYNSMTTFYSKFKDETGMTPASFRQKAKSLDLARTKSPIEQL